MADAAVKFEWHGDKLKVAIEGARKAALIAGGTELELRMRSNLSAPGPSTPGQPPGRRQGRLLRSIQRGNPVGNVVRVGTNLILGRWLEYGVFSRPKRGRFLAVPLNHAAERMYASLGLNEQGGRVSLRSKNLKLIRKTTGTMYLVEKTAKRGAIKKGGAIFKLQRTARIRPRPWVRRSFGEAKSRIHVAMLRAFADAMRKALPVTGGPSK